MSLSLNDGPDADDLQTGSQPVNAAQACLQQTSAERQDRQQALAVSQTIQGWMTPAELGWLYEAARSLGSAATWAELGTWKGRSLFTVAMGLPAGSRLIAVDVFDRQFDPPVEAAPTDDWVWDHFQIVAASIRQLRPDLELLVLRSPTAAAADSVAAGTCDVVFIDADHSAEGVRQDFANWAPRVKPGGLICGHDYAPEFPGVIESVNALCPHAFVVPDTTIWVTRMPE